MPWFGGTSSQAGEDIVQTCLLKPAECTANNYFMDDNVLYSTPTDKYYDQYGYVESAYGTGAEFPLYTYTVGDNSTYINTGGMYNPSLPFSSIIERVSANK